MIARPQPVFAVVAAFASVVIAGCASPTTPTDPSSATSAVAAPSSAPSSPAPTASPSTDATVVDIRIAGGTVTPSNGQAQGVVGKPIILTVDSDTADQLHVHSVPEHTFPVEPRPGQSFGFTVDVPGQVDIELHDLNRTVVTIQVRP